MTCSNVGVQGVDKRLTIWWAGAWDLNGHSLGIGYSITVTCSGRIETSLKAKVWHKGWVNCTS